MHTTLLYIGRSEHRTVQGALRHGRALRKLWMKSDKILEMYVVSCTFGCHLMLFIREEM